MKFFNLKIALIIIIVLSICSTLALIFVPHIEIINSDVTVTLNSQYKEPGYISRSIVKDFHDKTRVINKVDVKKVGEYKIDYMVRYGPLKIKKTRTVKVVDNEKPIITLKGKQKMLVCPHKEYKEPGFIANDNYDGDITNKVVVDNTNSIITYSVSDSSGNKTTITRNIDVLDNTKPILTLKGKSKVTITKGSKYKESGYKASDNCDGDITKKVVITNKLNTNKIGEYKIIYSVTDTNKNTVKKERIVEVIPVEEIPYYNPSDNKGIIYLTFDDGPSSDITPEVLKILKRQNVKATFFIIGNSKSLDYLIKQAYNDGHTIALHTSSHNYSKVYKSVDAYFKDLDKIKARVKKITGVDSNIIRFPGGSSNTVSCNYSIGIMSKLADEVEKRGYHYFDWNVSSGDAGGASNSYQVYNNVVNNLGKNSSNVVLMHDFGGNYKTLYALEDIIKFGKRNGYQFRAIDSSTPAIHHRISN